MIKFIYYDISMEMIPGAHRVEQSGIKGVKTPFDPNIMEITNGGD